MAKRSIWAKRQLKRLFELEGDVLDIIAIHEAATELFLESPLENYREKRSKQIKSVTSKLKEENNFTNLKINKGSYEGIVYIIKSGKGKYKIGRTNNIEHRIQTLQTSSYEKLQLVIKIETINCKALEKICHRKFANKRLNGEWFALTKEDLIWIINLPSSVGIVTKY